MPLDAPFRLGPFVVDTQGRLEPSEPGRFPSFHLGWRGCTVHARLDASGDRASLVLSAIIGRVPSSAGADAAVNRARRAASLRALHTLVSATGEDTQLRLLADHRITFAARRPVAMPASAGDLLTQITCFLLDLGPYLDLLMEADVPVESAGAVASAAVGTAKI
jgi:hypothetical protein